MMDTVYLKVFVPLDMLSGSTADSLLYLLAFYMIWISVTDTFYLCVIVLTHKDMTYNDSAL